MRTPLLFVAAAVAAAVAGVAAFHQPLSVAAALGAGVTLVVASRSPKWGFALWLVSSLTIPYWVGVDVAAYIPAAAATGFLILVPQLRGTPWREVRPKAADVILLLILASCAVLVVTGLTTSGPFLAMLDQWALAYLIGRVFAAEVGPDWIYRCLAVAIGVLGVLAVVELILDMHPFTGLRVNNPQYFTWFPVQERGGVARSEWALGHSIALGGVLAAGVPFVLGMRASALAKLGLLAAIAGGIAATGSRGALLAGGLSLGLSLLLMRRLSPALRGIIGVGVVGIAATSLNDVFGIALSADSETASSTSYRFRLFDAVVPQLQVVGQVAGQGAQVGDLQRQGFESVDSAFLGFAIQFGWILTLCLLALLGIAVVVAIRAGEPAMIAVVGQIPMLLTVYLITQYQIVVWLLVGLAVAGMAHRAPTRPLMSAGGRTTWPEREPTSPGVWSRRRPAH
ncbi:hypothetical protein ACI78Q_00060 [Geodermatophilus sp. SYSU D00705]